MAIDPNAPPRRIHDLVASNCNLARGWLQSLDHKAEYTQIPTATLELLLTQLIVLGEPAAARVVEDSGIKALLAHSASVAAAVDDMEEDQKTLGFQRL